MSGKSTSQDAFTKGEVYFFVTYPDIRMYYPLIESYVFLGMNFSEEDKEDTWYFQWASDFSQHGSALEGIERPVFEAKKEQLDEFQNPAQLMATIEMAAARRLKDKP